MNFSTYSTAELRGTAASSTKGIGADNVHGILDLDHADVYTKFTGNNLLNLKRIKIIESSCICTVLKTFFVHYKTMHAISLTSYYSLATHLVG